MQTHHSLQQQIKVLQEAMEPDGAAALSCYIKCNGQQFFSRKEKEKSACSLSGHNSKGQLTDFFKTNESGWCFFGLVPTELVQESYGHRSNHAIQILLKQAGLDSLFKLLFFIILTELICFQAFFDAWI